MTPYQQLYNYTVALVYLKRSSAAPYLRNRLICTSSSSFFKWVAHIGQKIHSCLRQRLCILSTAPHHKYYSEGDGFVLPVIVSVLFESTLCSGRLVDVYSCKCKTAVKRNTKNGVCLQVPELFGPIRTIAEGRGETVLIGTTKNFVLQGSLDGEFIPITQVDT